MNKSVRSGVLIVLVMTPHLLWAASYTNTASGGYWDSAASWTTGSGYPGAGDKIQMSAAGTITVTNNQQFGATSGSSTSVWGTTDNTVLCLTNGAVLTNNAGDTFMVSPVNNVYLRGGNGGERFINLGAFTHNSQYRLVNLTNGVTFEERGTNNFAAYEAALTIDGTSKMFVNNGTINATLNGYIGAKAPGATFTTFDGSTLQGMNIIVAANQEFGLGGIYTSMGSTLTGQVKIASLSIASGGILGFGNVSNMTVTTPSTLTAVGALYLGRFPIINQIAPVGSTVILGNDAIWNFGQGMLVSGSFVVDTGMHILTLQGTTNVLNITSVGNTTIIASNPGYLDNTGTLYVGPPSGSAYLGVAVTNRSGGVAIVNDGTFVLRNSDNSPPFLQAVVNIYAGTTFSNAAGGLFIGKSMSWPYTATVLGQSASTSVFDNQGTVQVTTNALTFHTTLKIPQLSGTSLNGGTWKASGGTNSVLNLPGSNLVTINTNAAVYLEDGGTINRIGTSLTTINGRFMVNNMGFTTGGSGLSVTNGGVLGGSGSVTGNVIVAANSSLDAGSATGTVGTLTIKGNVTLAAGARLTCDYTASTNDLVVVNGTLTLPATATVNAVGSATLTQPIVIFSANSLSGSVSGWTLTGGLSGSRVSIVGNTVTIESRRTGTVISTL